MKHDITSVLLALAPNASFAVIGDTYEGIEWGETNSQTKPTEQEIEVKLAELKYQEEVNVYQEKRKLEYPNWEDQLDKIYHSGVDAWKADIKKIKDKYPKQTMDATELQKRKDAVIFNLQKRDYIKASARLAQYELSAGKKGVVGIEKVWDANTSSYADRDIFDYVIQPLPIWVDNERNPLVIQDEKEREEAQEVINNTPQAVIDSVDN